MRYCERHGNHFWATCPTCRQHDKLRRISAYCRTLRAQVEQLEAELVREREDNRDIPTIAYMAGAADWKARATRAEAELAECKHELSSLRNTLDDLVTIQRERAEKAEAERDEAQAKCEKMEWLREVQAMWGEVTAAHLGDEVTDAGVTEYYAIVKAACAALAECGEGA